MRINGHGNTMWYIISRVFQMLVILALLSIVLFSVLLAMPGNPLDMMITSNPHIKPEDILRLKKLRGLDQPWYVQYGHWLWGYAEPARPPIIAPIEDTHEIINLKNYLSDPNFIPSQEQLIYWLNLIWPAWDKSVYAKRLENYIKNLNISDILLLLADHDPKKQAQLKLFIEESSTKNLKLTGLFGAKNHGLVLEINNYNNNIYFVITNSYGQNKIGRIVIKKNNLKNYFLPIKTQIVPELNKIFELDLNKFLAEPSNKNILNYKILENSPGKLSPTGIYTHKFNHDGSSVVSFSVRDNNNHEEFVAFDLEHGVIRRSDKFNHGFLFFLTDHDALGYSHTYKRPVYELLFGQETFCGDNQVDPGESCDDGLGENSFNCTSNCFLKNQNILDKINISISGYIYRSGRVGNTVQLMLPALLFSLLIAIPLGILSAYRQYSWLDYFINFLAFIGISLPVFWFGIMMIYLFAEHWSLLPAGGIQTPGIYNNQNTGEIILDRLSYAILPVLVLSVFYIGRWLRYMRASMLEILPQDYIRTARAKGLPERSVILKHGFRNALIPVVTILAISIPSLFGGAVLTETVFAWPGLGRLQYDAIMNSDYYVAIIVFLISALLVMLGNLIADIIYVLIDPRIRKS